MCCRPEKPREGSARSPAKGRVPWGQHSTAKGRGAPAPSGRAGPNPEIVKRRNRELKKGGVLKKERRRRKRNGLSSRTEVLERQRPRHRAQDTGRWGLAHGGPRMALCGALQAGAGSPRSTGIPGPLTSTPVMPPPRRCPCPGGPTSALPYPHSGSQTPHGHPAVRSGSLPVAPSSQLCRPLPQPASPTVELPLRQRVQAPPRPLARGEGDVGPTRPLEPQ